METPHRSIETVKTLIRLTTEALAGPNGFWERRQLEDDLKGYEAELDELLAEEAGR